MIKVNRNGEVWVFAEQHAGQLEDTPLELMGRARTLADTLKVPVGAVLLGHNIDTLAKKLIQYGADKVYMVEDPRLKDYQTTSYTKVVCDLIQKHEPQIVLYGATVVGRDLAPRIASAMKAGLTADCTDLRIGEHKINKTGVVHENLLLQIRPAFGGNIIATIINYDRWPQMATIREGVMVMPEPDGKRVGDVVRETSDLKDTDLPLEIIEEIKTARKVNLKAANIIAAGGAGVGSRANFKNIWDLANCLGGAVGATRAAIDLGYI
ncbi:MAG: electron transfer flavoprotein subunit alpha/FixB family protein, partial [Phycisphaeraceae bacterium]|nr:electron transfer flavoprotein subunit alpha/FixB family protein [Phycisphaeraceae bacterium]